MSAYPPPIENVPIFDASLFPDTVSSGGGLTQAEADALYLKWPFGQSNETLSGNTTLLGQTTIVNSNLILDGVTNTNYLEFPDGTKQYSAGVPATSIITAGTTNMTANGSITFNQYGQLTATTSGVIPSFAGGTFASPSSVSVNTYGQVTAITAGTPPTPVGGSATPFFSSSGSFPATNQSLQGGGLLQLQPQILFDVGSLDNFDNNTVVSIRYALSFCFGGASGNELGTQVTGVIDFYPTRVVYTEDNIYGIASIYGINNSADGTDTNLEFGASGREYWCYNTNEISGTPEMIGNNLYITINQGSTGQVIVGIFPCGQTYPYSNNSGANAPMRTSLSIELINQGNPNPAVPIKLTIPFFDIVSEETIWSGDPTALYTAVNGKLVYGGFELGTYIP